MKKKINLLLMMSEIEIENLDSLYLSKNIDNRYIQILIQIKIWLESKGEYREGYFPIIEGHQKKKKSTVMPGIHQINGNNKQRKYECKDTHLDQIQP